MNHRVGKDFCSCVKGATQVVLHCSTVKSTVNELEFFVSLIVFLVYILHIK